MQKNYSLPIIPTVSLGLTAVIGIMVMFLLAEEINGRFFLSLIFILIPYLLMSISILQLAANYTEHIMQNNLLVTIPAIHLAAAIGLTAFLNLLQVPLRLFLVMELILLGLGLIGIFAGISAKRHIENCDFIKK